MVVVSRGAHEKTGGINVGTFPRTPDFTRAAGKETRMNTDGHGFSFGRTQQTEAKGAGDSQRDSQKTIKITSMIKIERMAYNFIFEDL